MSPRRYFSLVWLWSIARVAFRRLFSRRLARSWTFNFEVMVHAQRLLARRFDRLSSASRREAWDALSMPPTRGVSARFEDLAGLRTIWLAPQVTSGRVVLYLHGGAYQWGSSATHRAVMAEIALRSAAQVVGPEYRLAPEHPFPAALDDALACYRALLESGVRPEQLIVMGDSAGGGLALALALRLKEQGLAPPIGLILLSPWVDLSRLGGGSLDANANADWLNRELLEVGVRAYAGPHDPKDPGISPLLGRLQDLPPCLVQVGSLEILRDQAVELGARGLAAGAAILVREYPEMIHFWQYHFRVQEAGAWALDEIAAFVRAGAVEATAGPWAAAFQPAQKLLSR
ncbi:MAG: alpha/beta hydrolase [Myxococcota bacterium]